MKKTKTRLFDHPTEERVHPVAEEQGLGKETGVQRVYHFPNGYGASIIRYKIGGLVHGDEYASYTNNENEWELGVLKKERDGKWGLTYRTPLTEDVIGYLTEDKVEKILQKISKL